MKGENLDIRLLGLDQSLYPPIGSAAEVVNMAHKAGTWIPAPGTSLVVNAGGVRIVSMGWFSTHNGQAQMLVEHGVPGTPGTLGYVHWPTATVVAIAADRRIVDVPTSRTSYLQQGNWIYCFSAYNAPIRWNGRRKSPVGFDHVPPPPTVSHQNGVIYDCAYGVTPFAGSVGTSSEFQRGVGPRVPASMVSLSTWKYGYRVTWVNDLGAESPPSAIAWLTFKQLLPVLTEEYVRKVCTLLQCAAPPAHVQAVRVWRTVDVYDVDTIGGEPPCYLLAELGPLSARMWVDDHADNELGMLLDTAVLGVVPGRIRCAVHWGGRAWCFTNSDGRLRYSAPLFIEQWGENDWVPVGGNGPGIALYPAGNMLVAFKERGVYVVEQSEDGSFRARTLSEEIGCACPDVVEVPGVGIVFLSDQGPCTVTYRDGAPAVVRFEGALLDRVWRRVNVSALVSACASIHRKENEAWFHVPTKGDNTANLGLVLHYPSGFWSTREDYVNAGGITCMMESKDNHADLFFGSPAGVSHSSRGYTAPSTSYKLGPMDFGARSTMVHAILRLVQEGSHSAKVYQYVNRAVAAQFESQTFYTLDPERGLPPYEGPPLWGAALWGTALTFEDVVPVLVRVDLHQQHALEHSLLITGSRVSLAGIRIVLEPNGVTIPTREMAGVQVPS